jgi:hypothetical protein
MSATVIPTFRREGEQRPKPGSLGPFLFGKLVTRIKPRGDLVQQFPLHRGSAAPVRHTGPVRSGDVTDARKSSGVSWVAEFEDNVHFVTARQKD